MRMAAQQTGRGSSQGSCWATQRSLMTKKDPHRILRMSWKQSSFPMKLTLRLKITNVLWLKTLSIVLWAECTKKYLFSNYFGKYFEKYLRNILRNILIAIQVMTLGKRVILAFNLNGTKTLKLPCYEPVFFIVEDLCSSKLQEVIISPL